MNGVHVDFIGNLTRDPEELRFSSNTGNAYLKIGVAVNDYKGPDQKPDTYYMDVTLFGRHAENALNRCRKGTQVLVKGQWRMRHFKRNDGSPGYAHEVSAREFHIFQRAQSNQEEGTENQARPGADQPTVQESMPGDGPADAPGNVQESPPGDTMQDESMETDEANNLDIVEAGDPFGDAEPVQ